MEYDPRPNGQLRFSPDGKAIVYPSREKGADNLWRQPLDGGPSRRLTNFTSLKIYSYQWSPDGKSLVLVRGDSPSGLVLIQNSQGKSPEPALADSGRVLVGNSEAIANLRRRCRRGGLLGV